MHCVRFGFQELEDWVQVPLPNSEYTRFRRYKKLYRDLTPAVPQALAKAERDKAAATKQKQGTEPTNVLMRVLPVNPAANDYNYKYSESVAVMVWKESTVEIEKTG